jgi:hypothetical protein
MLEQAFDLKVSKKEFFQNIPPIPVKIVGKAHANVEET